MEFNKTQGAIMKLDGRKLSHKTLEELRIRTAKQVEGGESPEVLAKALGLNRSTVYIDKTESKEAYQAAA